mgnify:CR=1 FL=1
MKYTINPCSACGKKFQNKDCNINDYNDCYVETMAAYEMYPSNNVMLSGDAKNNWKKCMSNMMATLPYVAGKPRDFCNFQLNTAPVFVGDHFFPKLLDEMGGDHKKALSECKLVCGGVKNKNQCKENCQVDHDALEQIELYKNSERREIMESRKKAAYKRLRFDTDDSLYVNKEAKATNNKSSSFFRKLKIPEATNKKCSSFFGKLKIPETYKAKLSAENPKPANSNRIYYGIGIFFVIVIITVICWMFLKNKNEFAN